MEYIGYWNDIMENDNLVPDYSDILEETYEGTQMSVLDFLHGYCTDYALCLWEMHKDFELFIVRPYSNERLIHAYCVYISPTTGQTWYLDVRGATTDTEMFFDEFDIPVDKKGELDSFFASQLISPDEIDWYINKYSPNSESSDEIKADAKTFADIFMQFDFIKIP